MKPLSHFLMLDCRISLLDYMATVHSLSGENAGPEGNGHFLHVPCNTFRAKIRHIVIAVIFDSFWPKLLEVPGNPAKLGAGARDGFTSPPSRGRHSEEVFPTLLGVEQDRLDSLRERGVIE